MAIDNSAIAARGYPIKFYCLDSALEWRAEFGGWIFAADTGESIWFPFGTTASGAMLHESTRGLSGRLL